MREIFPNQALCENNLVCKLLSQKYNYKKLKIYELDLKI